MATRERPGDRGRRLARRAVSLTIDELRQTRITLGLDQRALASAAGMSRSQLGRVERGEVEAPKLEDLSAVSAVLGLRLRMHLYPEGEPLHDRVQVQLLAAFRARIHPSLAWRTEVPLPIEGDRRAWDAVAIAEDGWTAIEAISKVGAVDGTLRRANQKQRDDARVARVVLLVADTAQNRRALRLGAAVVRAEYPLDTRAVMASLASGAPPALNGVAILRLPRRASCWRRRVARPQVVHSGGKLVDAPTVHAVRFVENPVGAGLPGP